MNRFASLQEREPVTTHFLQSGHQFWLEIPLPLRLLVFAIALLGGAFLGALISFEVRSFAAIWPPAGITLGVLMLERRRLWPQFSGVALGTLFVFEIWGHGHGVVAAMGLASANVVLGLSGVWLAQRLCPTGEPDLVRIRGVVALTVAALAAPLLSSTVRLVSVFLAGDDISLGLLPLWWSADVLGILVFSPLVLVWSRRGVTGPARGPLRTAECAGAFAALFLISILIFGARGSGSEELIPFPFFVFPFLFWIALRFGLHGTVAAGALLSLVCISCTAEGLGPAQFVTEAENGHAFLLQTFVLTSILSGLLLASIMTERRRSDSKIRELNASLERRVEDRTAELTASEKRFQTLAEAAPVGIFSTDTGGRCVYVNDRWCELAALGAEGAIGRRWLDVVDPRDYDHVLGRWEAARQDRRQFSLEFRLKGENGKPVWVFGQAAPADLEDGESGFIGTVTDISIRKQAESELQAAHDDLEERVRERTKELSKANVQLRENEARVRSVIDSAYDAFIAVDGSGVVTDWNPMAEKVLGRTREQAIGQRLAGVILPDEDGEKLRIALKYLFETTQGPLLGSPTEFNAQRADGRTFPAEMTISPAGVGAFRFFSIFLRDITDRKSNEERVRESESVMRSFFDSTPLMMGLVELLSDDIIHISDNSASARFFGTAVEDMRGKRASELGMTLPVIRLWSGYYRESKELGEPLHFEYLSDSPDGQRQLSVTVCFATTGPAGLPRFAYAIEDITDRRVAEVDLREKTVALENAAEGVARIDSQGRFVSVNRAFSDVTGFSSKDLIGEEWLTAVHPDDRAAMKVAYRTMLGQGKAEQEVRGIRKDGAVLYQQLVIVSTYDPQGTFIGHYFFVRDITSRKRAEVERDRFFTMSLDMLCIAGMNGYFRRMNPAFEQSLGYSIAELQATPFVNFVHPDDRQRTIEVFSAMAQGRECVDFENRYRCKDGTYKWLSWTATPFAKEEIVYAVARDVTERKRVEQEILQSLEEKDVLLKEIHHRVKNNLQVVSSLLQLQSGYIKDKSTLEIFRESQNRIRSMAIIHEKLYQTESLARIDFEEYATSLAAILVRSYSTTSGVKLVTDIDKITLNIDTAVPIGLITNELLSNALKYAFSDGRAGIITVALKTTPGSAHGYELRISDNGIGLPPDIKIDNAASLGLRLVKILTGQVGGELSFSSTPEGTMFTIAFSDGKP